LSIIIFCPVQLFLYAFIVWVLGKKIFGGTFDYMKAVEVIGLATVIGVLERLISMLLAVIYADPSMTPGPILFVGHFNPDNKLHVILSLLNVTTLWWLAVLSLGLARLSGASIWKAGIWLFGLWYGFWAALALGLPLLMKKMGWA
jgi:hypothetical protein